MKLHVTGAQRSTPSITDHPCHYVCTYRTFSFSFHAVAMGDPKVASNQATAGSSGLPARVFSYTLWRRGHRTRPTSELVRFDNGREGLPVAPGLSRAAVPRNTEGLLAAHHVSASIVMIHHTQYKSSSSKSMPHSCQ